MAAISNYARNKFLDLLFGKASWSLASDGSRAWIALATASPDSTTTGATLAEPSGNAYARVSTTASAWGIATAGQVDNASAFTFPEATGSWGTITSFAIVDNATPGAGNILMYGDFTTPKAVTNGVTPKIDTGALILTFTAGHKMSNYLRQACLAHLVGKTAFTSPTNIYVALATTAPTVTTTGSTITGEPSGSGYSRLSTGASDWSSASSGETHNTGQLDMAAATGTWASGSDMATAILLDASSNGNLLLWGVPSVTKSFANLDRPYFAASDLSFTLN